MEKHISTTQYQEGLFNISQYLVSSLISFLKDEGRYKFRMIDYIKSIQYDFETASIVITPEDLNIYGRVLYNLKKAIPQDYKRLRTRNLSPADSVICLIKKLYDVSESLEGENRFKAEQSRIGGYIKMFFENMKSRVKLDPLWITEKTILDSVKNQKWGTLCLKELDLYHLEHPEYKPKIQEILEEKTTLDLSGEGKEVSF